jgi:hypothetical protein
MNERLVRGGGMAAFIPRKPELLSIEFFTRRFDVGFGDNGSRERVDEGKEAMKQVVSADDKPRSLATKETRVLMSIVWPDPLPWGPLQGSHSIKVHATSRHIPKGIRPDEA